MEGFGREGGFVPKVCKRIRRKLKDDSKEDVDLYLLRKILDNTETTRYVHYNDFKRKFFCIFEILSSTKNNEKKEFIIHNTKDFQKKLKAKLHGILQGEQDNGKNKTPFFIRLKTLFSISQKEKKLIRLKQISTNKIDLTFRENGKILDTSIWKNN